MCGENLRTSSGQCKGRWASKYKFDQNIARDLHEMRKIKAEPLYIGKRNIHWLKFKLTRIILGKHYLYMRCYGASRKRAMRNAIMSWLKRHGV